MLDKINNDSTTNSEAPQKDNKNKIPSFKPEAVLPPMEKRKPELKDTVKK